MFSTPRQDLSHKEPDSLELLGVGESYSLNEERASWLKRVSQVVPSLSHAQSPGAQEDFGCSQHGIQLLIWQQMVPNSAVSVCNVLLIRHIPSSHKVLRTLKDLRA